MFVKRKGHPFKMPLEKPRPKTPKRVMEKKRRARINDSLTELKNLVLQALNRNNPRHSKLEKADILEMTVKYLRGVHGRHIAAKTTSTPDPDVLIQYRSGFAECMHEVSNFFESADGNPGVIKLQLLDHLSRSCGTPQSPAPTAVDTNVPVPTSGYRLSPTDGNITQPLPIFRIPTKTSQVPLHSALPTLLPTNTVQSVSTMQINNPPILPIMNIQFPNISRIPVPAPVSLPAPPVTLQPPLTPLQQPMGTPVGLEGQTVGESSSKTRHMQGHTIRVAQGELHSQSSTLESARLVPVNGDTTVGGDITVILPQAALPGGKLPTHLIPVYQPNDPYMSNVIAAVASPCQPGPSSAHHVTPDVSATVVKVDPNATSPCASIVTPIALLTRPTYLTANIGQTSPVFSPQGTPFTITLPVQARIVPNIIPIQATHTVSPVVSASNNTHTFSLPLRIASPVQNLDENGFMWRPW